MNPKVSLKSKLNPKKVVKKVWSGFSTLVLSYAQQYSKIKWQKLSKATKLAVVLTIFFVILGMLFFAWEKFSIFLFTLLRIIDSPN